MHRREKLMITNLLPSWEERLLVLSIRKLLREWFQVPLAQVSFLTLGIKHLGFHSLQVKRNSTDNVCHVIQSSVGAWRHAGSSGPWGKVHYWVPSRWQAIWMSPYYMGCQQPGAEKEKIRLMAALSLTNQVALSMLLDLPKPVFTSIKQ